MQHILAQSGVDGFRFPIHIENINPEDTVATRGDVTLEPSDRPTKFQRNDYDHPGLEFHPPLPLEEDIDMMDPNDLDIPANPEDMQVQPPDAIEMAWAQAIEERHRTGQPFQTHGPILTDEDRWMAEVNARHARARTYTKNGK